MTFPKELKEAIAHLPSEEKDKLIFRLLKHDYNLANQLLFQLVDTDTVEDKRAIIASEMEKELQRTHKRFYSLGVLLMDMRFISGKITDHLRITKDKLGEITLNLQMLHGILSLNKEYILQAKPKDAYTFCIYVIARAYKILVLIKAQHEDMWIEFREDLATLGNLISDIPILMKFAIQNGLDINWLLSGEIPEDIVAIHKELRANGYLK